MNLHTALAILATLTNHAARTHSALAANMVAALSNALQREHGAVPVPTQSSIDEIPLRDVLATATMLRDIAQREGVRDEFDARMDALYTYAYTLERRRQFSRRAA